MAPGDGRASPHVAFFLPHLGGGGTERMVAALANGLSAQGYRVDMVLVQAVGTYLEGLSSDIGVVDLRARNSYLAVPGLMAYLRRSSPQVLISSLSLTNILALIATRLSHSHTRVAIRLESTVSAQRRVPWKKALEKPLLSWIYPWADRIIAVSRAVATDASNYLHISPERIDVIYNPVLNERSVPAADQDPAHPWLAEGCHPVVLAVGRLVPVKDFPTLIKAFARVRAHRPTRLIILGEGEQRLELEALAQDLRVADDVDLPGFVTNAEAYMRGCAVFVLSSLYEGLPTALIEALASGCPIVSTDCPGGSREILADGRYGEMVPVGDERAMAAAIERVLDGRQTHVEPAWLDQFRLEGVLLQTVRILGLPPLKNE